jgi:peptidoglycan/LPS O-acetylase OafA/YrhL
MAALVAELGSEGGLAELVTHPAVFGFAGGAIAGALAAFRGMPVSPKAAIVTSLVTAGGELALVYDLPEGQRPNLPALAAWSAGGTLAALALFVSWTPDGKGLLQQIAESVADRMSAKPLPG